MADTWQTVRAAIVAKMAASTLMATAGLRAAVLTREETKELPLIEVGEPLFSPGDQQNAYVSEYVLEYPLDLVMPIPAGRKREQPTAAAIMRALQEEWRSGFGMGLTGLVVDSHPGEATAIEQTEDTTPGYRGSIIVQLYETHSARTF
jgi:hypothetical protein